MLWHTGATSEVVVARPRPGCRTPEVSRRRIAELAVSLSDDQIAAQLNAESLPTARRGPWTPARVRVVRAKWRIASGKPYPPRQMLPRNQGFCSASEAAMQLHVSPGMVCEWYRRGRLVGYQERKRTGVWIRLTPADLDRYSGAAPLTVELILEAEAPIRTGADRRRNPATSSSGPPVDLSPVAQPCLALVCPAPRDQPATS